MILEVTAVSFSLKNAGGGERFPTEFYKELKKNEKVIFCYSSKERELIDDTSILIPSKFLKLNNIITEVNPIPTIDSIKAIKRLLNEYEKELEFIHIHNLRTAMSTLWLLLLLKRRTKNLKVILTDHNAKFFPFPKLTVKPVDYYAPVSKISDEILQRYGRKPLFILPISASSTFQAKSFRLDFMHRDIDLLFLGRIVPWKGVDKVISIAEKLIRQGDSKVKVVIAGRAFDQNYLNLLKTMVYNKNLNENVEFIINPNDDEIHSLYARSKVHILFSVTYDLYGRLHQFPELNPTTIVEASMSGTPTIVSDPPRLKEQVFECHTGYIAPENDSDLATSKISFLIHKKKTRETMSQNAFEYAIKERTLSSVVEKFQSDLNKIRNGNL